MTSAEYLAYVAQRQPAPNKQKRPATVRVASDQAQLPDVANEPASGPPAAAKRKPKRKGPSPTSALTTAVLTLLHLHGCQVWRQNNGGTWDPTRQVFRAGSATPGIADIIGFHRATGRFVGVEIKSRKDVLSDAQQVFLDNITAAGGFGCEGRSVEQVGRELAAWLAK